MKKITLSFIIIIILIVGCKPQEKIIERVVTKTDSTSITRLQEKIDYQEKIIASLKVSLESAREEIVNLQSETSRHEIIYDTDAAINPQTGQYPKQSEAFLYNKKNLDKSYQEYEKRMSEYNQEIRSNLKKITSLEDEVEMLKNENRQLITETKSSFGINVKACIVCFITGLILPTIYILRKRIKHKMFVV